MSYQATRAVLDGPRSIKGACLSVLSVLAEWADKSGEVNFQKGPIHLAAIGDRARCSMRSVTNAVAWLEREGYLLVERPGGRGQQSRYRVNIELLREQAAPVFIADFATYSNEVDLGSNSFVAKSATQTPDYIADFATQAGGIKDDGILSRNSEDAAERAREQKKPATHPVPKPSATPKLPPRPPQPPPDSDAGRQISLLRELEAAGARLLDRPLTKSHRKYLHGWFQGYKRELTGELIEYAEGETARLTDGESLGFMLKVIENKLAGVDKPRRTANGNGNGNARQHPEIDRARYTNGGQYSALTEPPVARVLKVIGGGKGGGG